MIIINVSFLKNCSLRLQKCQLLCNENSRDHIRKSNGIEEVVTRDLIISNGAMKVKILSRKVILNDLIVKITETIVIEIITMADIIMEGIEVVVVVVAEVIEEIEVGEAEADIIDE